MCPSTLMTQFDLTIIFDLRVSPDLARALYLDTIFNTNCLITTLPRPSLVLVKPCCEYVISDCLNIDRTIKQTNLDIINGPVTQNIKYMSFVIDCYIQPPEEKNYEY